MNRLRLALAAAVLLCACSDNPPQLGNIEWQVILFHNRILGATYQKLSVFVSASDKDGQKDLAALHVINDEAELYWTVSSERWEKATIRGAEWFGSNGLAMPSGQPLPVGLYRIVLEDLGGKTVEAQIYLKPANVETAEAKFPEVAEKEGKIALSGNFIDPEVWVYDSNEQFVARFVLPERSIAISSIIEKNQNVKSGFTYYVYAKQSGVYYGVMSGPFYHSP